MNFLFWHRDPSFAAQIDCSIKQTLNNTQLFCCTESMQAQLIADRMHINLFIIDIDDEMGYEFARKLRKSKQYAMAWLIVISQDEARTIEAYEELHCFFYLVKPLDLHNLISKIVYLSRYSVSRVNVGNDYLTVSSKGTQNRILIDSIQYIEINQKHLRIMTNETPFELDRYPLAKVKAHLPRGSFIQCHRSFIINKTRVCTVHCTANKAYVMIGSECIPVGNTYIQTIRDLFNSNREIGGLFPLDPIHTVAPAPEN